MSTVTDAILKCSIFRHDFQILSDESRVGEIGGEKGIDKNGKYDKSETTGAKRGKAERG